METSSSVGSALPPRRDQLVLASAAQDFIEPPSSSGWGNSINVPLARDRMLEYFEREQVPNDVRSTLAAALNGDLHLQSLLFTAMMDTWPRLQKAVNEIARMVSIAPWKVQPFALRGEKPDATAEKLAKDVENLIWTMKPRATRRENGMEGTIKALVRGYYYGHGVAEIRWKKATDGAWKPRCTKGVPARYYGYPYDALPAEDPEDRLMFDPEGGMGMRRFVDFPEHRFLTAINPGHEGHAAVAAPLRALSAYWLAAVYGLKWFINFTQLYGIPWRHAEVGDSTQENVVKAALASIGSNGYIVTKPGTKINILESSKGGSAIPSKDLIALADQQCDQFILGQTLTGGTDNSGSRALGEVHEGTLERVVDGVADFVGEILTHQLLPAVVSVNWGERDDVPEMWAKREEKKDEKAASETMEVKLRMGIPMTEAYVYESTGTPIPAPGDKLFEPPVKEAPVLPGVDPADEVLGKDPAPPAKKPKPVEASDASRSSRLTVDELSDAVLEGLTGVTREWLSPVRPAFERLAALAMSDKVTDEDFIAALEKAQSELPELFDLLDTGSLQTAFENAIGSAALAGSVKRYEP